MKLLINRTICLALFFALSLSADNSQCERYTTAPLSLEEKRKYKTWPIATDPSIVSYQRQEARESLYGYSHAMKVIWDHQHPHSCKDAKFLIFSAGGGCGFGCDVHFEAVALRWAMHTGRVFLRRIKHEHSNICYAFQYNYCQQAHEHNWRCYYEAESSCSLEDVLPGLNRSDPSTWTRSEEGIPVFNVHKPMQHRDAKVLLLETSDNSKRGYGDLPESIGPFIECAKYAERGDGGTTRKWWDAVAAAFLLRPNPRTLATIQTLSTFDLAQERDPVIGVYVRHGDKRLEMPLVPWIQYANAAQQLWDSGVVHRRIQRSDTHSPYRPTRNGTIFVGTEDPVVIDEAVEWGKRHGWKVLYTNILNRSWLAASYLKDNEFLQPGEYAGGHHELEMPSILLNIHHFLHCSAWVATMGSTFNHLLDELKITVAGKADLTTADLRLNTPPLLFTGLFTREMELQQEMAAETANKATPHIRQL